MSTTSAGIFRKQSVLDPGSCIGHVISLSTRLSDSGGWALAQEWAEVLGQPVGPEQPDSPRCCLGLALG